MAKSESLILVLQKIDSLFKTLNTLKPLKREDEARLWKKFRLEWNYNSNHIEGNTLTYQETELLLIFGRTSGDHDLREYQEMKAHDVALELIRGYASDESREITESDIRQLNKIILVEPYWGNAITHDGQPTRKLIEPGIYKREPNSVKLQNGEMFHYATPDETPAKMKELMEWYRLTTTHKKLHPVEIAARLHYDFVRIHPFDDSNGRTSRLIMNYVLLRFGFPPVIIKSADKKSYLTALNKADVGDIEAFIEYIATELIWSITKSIDAAQGKSIEEPDDLEKEIAVWKKATLVNAKDRPKKTEFLIRDIYNTSIANLFVTFAKKQAEQFNNVFLENENFAFVNGQGRVIKDFEDLSNFFLAVINGFMTKERRVSVKENNVLSISCSHYVLMSEKPNQLNVKVDLIVTFTSMSYEIAIDDYLKVYNKSYLEPLSNEETNSIVKQGVQRVFDAIRRKEKQQ